MTSAPVVNLIKHFTIVIYDSRVVWLGNCPCYDSRVVIYERKLFLRLATGIEICIWVSIWGKLFKIPLCAWNGNRGDERWSDGRNRCTKFMNKMYIEPKRSRQMLFNCKSHNLIQWWWMRGGRILMLFHHESFIRKINSNVAF